MISVREKRDSFWRNQKVLLALLSCSWYSLSPARKQERRNSSHASVDMSSVFQVSREELPSPSPQKRPAGDGDSGYHEPIDDAAAFEHLPPLSLPSSFSSPLSGGTSAAQLLQQHAHVVGPVSSGGAGRGLYPYRSRSNEVVSSSTPSDSAYSTTASESFSPLSPSPRLLAGGNNSISSNGSVMTQPDSGERDGGSPTGQTEEAVISFLSPDTSPAGSEEDVSGKGERRSSCRGVNCIV